MKRTDGRNIDPALGVLEGEAATVRTGGTAELGATTLRRIDPDGPHRSTTYHEQPVLKAPVWKSYIPSYLFVGGGTGALLVLGAAAQLAGRSLRPIVRPARWIAAGGAATSAVLLVADLGRPSRFLNMLRVFRPTSPMNMGTWILSAAGVTGGAAAALPLLGLDRLADVAGLAAGPFGAGLASYTAVLIVDSAIPVWHHGRRSMPPLFVASAVATAASALDLVPGLGRARGAVRIFGTVGRIAELVAARVYEGQLRAKGEAVSAALDRGNAAPLWKASKLLGVASLAGALAAAVLERRGRARRPLARAVRLAGGIAGLLGPLALRFAILEAGRASARDPRATFEPQRREREARLAATERRQMARLGSAARGPVPG